jgi:electron transfer flavoprotein alpha subunit
MNILLITEQRDAQWNKTSFETLAAAQQIAAETKSRLAAVVIGKGVSALAGELAASKLDEVLLVEHDLLAAYTPDGYTLALQQVIAQSKPDLVLLPHTYQVRDFAPKLATALNRVLVSDVISYRIDNGALVLVRQLFQGKINADVRFEGDPPYFASIQAGAFRADNVQPGTAPVEKTTPDLKPEQIRTKPLEPFRESQRAVDLGAAQIIVSVGRGIKEAKTFRLCRNSPMRWARNSPHRVRFAITAGCRWSARWGVRARPWRRRCTWRWGFQVRSSIWWG